MDFDFSAISGLLSGIGETDDIPSIINQFAQILAEIIKIITSLFNGGATEEETTAAPVE